MKLTRRKTTKRTVDSSTSPFDTEQPEKDEVEVEPIPERDPAETAGEPGSAEPQTLDDYTPPRRGYMDRMLRPQRGMELMSWGGKSFWKCPRCGRETFDEAVAKAHRC